jgi:hypothetical protein
VYQRICLPCNAESESQTVLDNRGDVSGGLADGLPIDSFSNMVELSTMRRDIDDVSILTWDETIMETDVGELSGEVELSSFQMAQEGIAQAHGDTNSIDTSTLLGTSQAKVDRRKLSLTELNYHPYRDESSSMYHVGLEDQTSNNGNISASCTHKNVSIPGAQREDNSDAYITLFNRKMVGTNLPFTGNNTSQLRHVTTECTSEVETRAFTSCGNVLLDTLKRSSLSSQEAGVMASLAKIRDHVLVSHRKQATTRSTDKDVLI